MANQAQKPILEGLFPRTVPGAEHCIGQGLTRKESILGISSRRDVTQDFVKRICKSEGEKMEGKVPHTLVTDTCLVWKEQKGGSEATVLPTKAAEVRVQLPADDPGAGTAT